MLMAGDTLNGLRALGAVLALVRTRCGLYRYSTGCGASVGAVLDGFLKRVILAGEAAPLFPPFGGGRGLNFGLPNAVASRRPSARQPGGATARTLARRSNAPRSNDTPKLASSRTRPERPWIGGKGARRSAR